MPLYCEAGQHFPETLGLVNRGGRSTFIYVNGDGYVVAPNYDKPLGLDRREHFSESTHDLQPVCIEHGVIAVECEAAVNDFRHLLLHTTRED